MLLRKTLIAGLLLFSTLTVAGPPVKRPVKPLETLPDRVSVIDHFRALGHRTHGRIDKATADRVEAQGRTFPTFSSSFSVGGVTYPFTMIGYPPRSGRSASIRTVIIPLRMNFVFFGDNFDVSHSFDPAPAVANITGSPLYRSARFANGTGQFVDQMQRAAFWNQMDPNHNWHVRMDEPEVTRTIDIEVTPETGALFVRELGGLDSIQDIAAAGGTVEATDDVQQGRFPGAGRAGNRQPVAAIERQINIDQRVNRRLTAVLFANPFELEHRDRGAAFERDHFASLLGALSYPTTTSCPLARAGVTEPASPRLPMPWGEAGG